MKTIRKSIAIFLVLLTLYTTCSVSMPVFAAYENVTSGNVTDGNIYDVNVEKKEDAKILSEITEKRDRAEKHFLMSDGTFMVARYPQPVHYQNSEGEWLDYDNTLSEADATTEQISLFGTEEIFSTNNQVENVVFAKKSNSNTLVSYEAKDCPISFNYQSAKKSNIKTVEKKEKLEGNDAFLSLPNLTREVIYENVFDNVDLQYIVSPNGIKENIILKSSSAQNSFTVNYNIGELTAEAVSENVIHLIDRDDVIYVISAPVMYDANGNSSSEIELNITKNKNGKLTFEIVPDKTWLATATYPVTIDPSITDKTNSNVSAYVNGSITASSCFTLSYDSSDAVLNLEKLAENALVEHVVSAKLNLPVVANSIATNSRVYIRDAAETDVVEDYMNITATSSELSFDITELYSEWENGETNNGVKLEMATTGNVSVDLANPSKPLLTVQYLSTSGVDPFMPYTEFDMGSAGCVYINNFTGNLVITRGNEIATTGANYPYTLSRAYNSLSSEKWISSYETGFKFDHKYIDETGAKQDITFGTDEEWASISDETDATGKVVAVSAIKSQSADIYKYDDKGLLAVGTTANPMAIFSRGEADSTGAFNITDGSGQKLHISENDSSYTVTQLDANGNNIENGASITYTYGVNKAVTEIKRNDAVEATFTYENGEIKTISDDDNHTLEFVYAGKKISKVTEKRGTETGTTVSFTRTANTVTTRTAGANGEYGDDDDDDSLVTSRFDSSLNLLGESYATVSGESLGAVSYDRDTSAETTSAFDGISRVGVTGRNPENLLENHSIEGLSGWSATRYSDNNCNCEVELDGNAVHSGQNSVKITVNDVTTNGGACVYQRLDYSNDEFERGKSYVLSAYVKIDEAIIRDADASANLDYGATLLMRAVKSDGTSESVCGENVQITDGTVDGGWSRIFVYFTVPDNCEQLYLAGLLRNGTGTAYFDSFQLEEGNIPSQYNLVENNGFEQVDSSNSPVGWTRFNLEGTDAVTDGEFRITGNPDMQKGLYQNIYIPDASQEDTYVFSAWSHGNGAPAAAGRHYALYGFIYYVDADETIHREELPVAYFDSNNTDEQFLSMSFDLATDDATWTPYRIRVAVCYYQGVNDVYFDDVSLIRTNDVIDLTETETEEEETTDPYTYDENGNILTYTDTDDSVYHYTYDDNGNLVSRLKTVTDENGVETQVGDRYTYVLINGEYYIKTETYEDGISYTYNYRNNDTEPTLEKETIVSDDVTEEYNYDENENLTSYVVDNEVKSSYTYIKPNDNWLIETGTREGYLTTYTYNTETDELLSKVKSPSDDVDTVIESDSYEYSNGNVTKHTHTENGTSLTYHYGTDGEITKVDHNGFSYVYEYDNFGNTTNVSVDDNPNDNNNGQSLVQYNYQADKSKLASMTYGNGDTVSYEYDNYGSISKKILSDKISDGSTNNYYYTYLIDGEGRPIYEKDSMSGERTTYQYDFKGNLVSERVYNTLSYTYANQLYEINNNFDEDGNIIKNALQTHVGTLTTNYAYDAESGLPSSVTLFGGRSITYNYDDEGTLTGRSLSTNTDVEESFAYSDDGLISTHTINHGTDSDVYSYTYDDNYNITEIKLGDTVQQSYVYDELNQLIRENDSDTGKTVVYEYDNYGNIEKKTEYAFALGELGAAVDTVEYEYDSAWKDKLKFYDGVEIHYDDIGNPTTYRGATMTWFGRQMMSYSIENEIDISYTYDADGLRTSKTVNGVKHNYYYVDGQLRYERNGDSYEIYYTYDADGRPVLATKRDLVAKKNYQYYLITNTRGDIIETRNGDGNVNARFVYDAWGKLIAVTDANGNVLSTDSFAYQISLKYRGYVYDNETGLYYLQSRYYDPETGRFINADAVEYIGYSGGQLSYNMFAYCENKSVTTYDPNGNTILDTIRIFLFRIMRFFNKGSVSVFSVFDTDWLISSRIMGENLRQATGARTSEVLPVFSYNFVRLWNNLDSEYAIIHTHGNQKGIYDEDSQEIFGLGRIGELERNSTIRCLIITACQTARTTNEDDINFAQEISRNINRSGLVVASTGFVEGADTDFASTGVWCVYRNGVLLDLDIPRTITMQSIYQLLRDNDLI